MLKSISMRNNRMLGNGLLMLTALIWGTAFVFQRVGMDSIEPITFNAARMVLAGIVIGPIAYIIWRKEQGDPAAHNAAGPGQYGRNTIMGGVCCGCFLSIASILQQMGLVYTTAGKAGFITAMYMLLVPVIGAVFFKRKNTWLVWSAVLLGVAGMYLLCITEEFRFSYGDMLVSLCALFFSFHILCCDHFSQRGNPICISAVQFVTATVISGVAAVIFEDPDAGKVISALIPILYCGIVSGGIGYTLQIVAQKRTDPTAASLILSLESVFAAIAGAILLRERMTTRELAGCIILFAAVILVQLPAARINKD